MALNTLADTIGGVARTLLVALDASGNIAVAHVNVTAGGIETGTPANPLVVAATALPLPAGASTEVTLAAINAKLAALLAAEQPYQGVVPMTVGTAVTAGRALRINCATAGNVGLTYADGSSDVVPVNVGLSYLAGAITTVTTAGTTATATYANMR